MNHLLKTALALIVVAFVLLFILTTFVPPPAAEYAEARRFFSLDEIATGETFGFGRKLFFWASTALELGLLIALVVTGAARRLADTYSHWLRLDVVPAAVDGSRGRRLRAWAGSLGRWLVVLLLMGATYAILHELLQFPLSVGRFYYSRAWGMTDRPLGDWLREYALGLGVNLIGEMVAGVGLYLLLRWFPRTWYLWGAGGGLALAFAVAYLMPIVIAPLFNTFTPIGQTRWYKLEPAIRQLAERAGISVSDIYVMDASRQGHHTNAYFSGLGSTQSIVLYDTLLEKHTPDEVQSILAHEIGHWQHRHIIQGILLGALAGFVGLIVLDRCLRWFRERPPVYLHTLSDPAGVPLVLLLGYLGTWIAMPLENAVSRHFERQADMTSLELAGMPDVFIAAERKLAVDNKSNVVAAPWNVWLFSTHPTALQRIEMARQWQQSP
jgi:STE24 endopeptidase